MSSMQIATLVSSGCTVDTVAEIRKAHRRQTFLPCSASSVCNPGATVAGDPKVPDFGWRPKHQCRHGPVLRY